MRRECFALDQSESLPFIQITSPLSLPLCTLALGRRSDIDQKAWHLWMRAYLQTVGLFPRWWLRLHRVPKA
ncbi:unnamed protein product [Sphagnum jensenii]|uniref:Uncharacterized protein n=1 Tax=Sphagnum jensenii TaxID=128206 RepID=A0ABP1C0E6_9BRYO